MGFMVLLIEGIVPDFCVLLGLPSCLDDDGTDRFWVVQKEPVVTTGPVFLVGAPPEPRSSSFGEEEEEEEARCWAARCKAAKSPGSMKRKSMSP